MKTRRQFLASAATTAALTPLAASAAGRHFGEPRVITTIKIVNHSRSEVAAGAVTQLIGCPFKKGDIAPGSWPQFQLTDGTPVPATILTSLATTWSDKSLKFVPVMLQIPVAIGAHVKVHIKVLSDGAFQQGSARSLADFTNGISPQVQVDGLDNLKGTWVMDLGQGIADGKKVITYGNGPAGGVWKVRARATQGSKRHHHLVCDFYVAALSNMDGSLKGLRVLGKVKLPYYDTKHTMKWMSFSRFQLCANSGGPLVRDCFGKNFGPQRAYKFSWDSGALFYADHKYSTANGGDYGYCTRLSSTGQLPSGLSANQSYFTAGPDAQTIGFATNSADPYGNRVYAGDNGVGKHTATPYPYLAYFGALFTAGPSGMWDFVQGAGSDSADAPLRYETDLKYSVSTGLVPSYDVKVKPTSSAPTQYWPNCSEPVVRYLETTGERPDIGIFPSWYARHLLTQSAADERLVRVVSLIGGQFSIGVESKHTRTIPVVNNGSDNNGKAYPNMPAPNYWFRWRPAGTQSQGFQDTTDPNVQIAGFNQQITSHMPQFNYYPYLLTGEPWHLDMLIEHANSAVYQRYTPLGTADISVSEYTLGSGERSLQVGQDPASYGHTIGSGEQRGDAWASALVGAAAGLCPDLHPECKSYKRYLGDLNANSWHAACSIFKALPSFAKKRGLWSVPDGTNPYIDHWQMAYFGAAASLAAAATENHNAFVALGTLVKWFDHVVAEFGGWHAGSYMTVIKSGAQTGSPIVTSNTGVGFYGPTINWSAGGRFTVLLFSNYTPSNGDKFIFGDPISGVDQVTPGGFSKYTPYYMVNLNGNQFDLAASPGGLPIAPTDSYSGTDGFFFVSSKPPASGSISGIGYPTAYNTEVAGMLNYAVAVGVSVNPTTIADLSNRDKQAGLDFTADPKWAMKSTFAQ